MSINYKHTIALHNQTSAEIVLPFIFNRVNITSVLDIGCGNGSWLKTAKDYGALEVFGVDGIEPASRNQFISSDEFLLHDLSKPLDLKKTYDLVMSLEVAEHLPEEHADLFVKHLTSHGNIILFSAAIPNQGGQYHLNEQWPEYWHQKFKSQGYKAYDIIRKAFWNHKDIFWWYRQNMILYVKDTLDIKEIGEPSETIEALVHPSLYQKKIFHPKYLKQRSDLRKLVLNTLKYILKGK